MSQEISAKISGDVHIQANSKGKNVLNQLNFNLISTSIYSLLCLYGALPLEPFLYIEFTSLNYPWDRVLRAVEFIGRDKINEVKYTFKRRR